jgi:hypothetical protein
MIRNCHHGYPAQRCPISTCPNSPADTPLHIRLFGKHADGALAQKIHQTDPTRYAALRQQAIDAGLLPPDPRVPAALQDDDDIAR